MSKTKYAEQLEQPSVPETVWKAALYIRLSREDGDKAESDSVTFQREILKEYVKQHPDMETIDFYIDDGWSGTNFDRPGFMRMMEDIHAGKVNCIVVKDLSRFARNYSEASRYIDDVFVRMRVRFVALNNGLDTAAGNMNAAMQCISVGVTNVINESLAATTSVNVRGTLNVNRRQGLFIGSFACYGYRKDPEDHHKLLVDEEAAEVVRWIFRRFLAGQSIIGIAKELNEQGVPNPSRYKQLKGMKCNRKTNEDGFWPDSSVRRILRNEMYLGHMVQGKNAKISYKLKQCRAVPQEDWVVVRNTHEPIVSQEDFDRAQALFGKGARKSPKQREIDLFSGFLRCADCGRTMNKKTNAMPYGTYVYYRCVTKRKMHGSACTNHTVRADRLETAVKERLQELADEAVAMRREWEKHHMWEMQAARIARLQQELDTRVAEREHLLQMMADLYPDYKSGILSQEEYHLLKTGFHKQMDTLEKEIAALEKEKTEWDRGAFVQNEFVAHFEKLGKVRTLTRAVLLEYVEEIRILEGGEIEVVFKYREAYQRAVEYTATHTCSCRESA